MLKDFKISKKGKLWSKEHRPNLELIFQNTQLLNLTKI